MHHRSMFASAVAAVALLAAGWASGEGIHIAGDRTTNWHWQQQDGAGFRWDITSHGTVNDGTNDAYDGGMQLQINGSQFSHGGPGKVSKDGREVETGPYSAGGVRVWRRIYVDKETGYCRWIDIFENTESNAREVNLRYYTNLGGSIRGLTYSSGDSSAGKKDYAVMTHESSSSRPSVVHVYATANAKVKPRVEAQIGSDNIYYYFTLKIPPNKLLAVCTMQAQRRGGGGAEFLKEVKVEKELKKIPPRLRRIIVNMGGAMLTLGRLELSRHEAHDLVILRNGDEMLGTLGIKSYTIDTAFGKVTLPPESVVGFSAPAPEESIVHLGLVDGQVLSGKLALETVPLKLNSGSELSLRLPEVASAAYQVSPERPEEIEIGDPIVAMRSGQRLIAREEDLEGAFLTEFGKVPLRGDEVRAIYLDTQEGGLHRVVFLNESVLSGLLAKDSFTLHLLWDRTWQIRRHAVGHFTFPAGMAQNKNLAVVSLKNENILYGRFVDEKVRFTTSAGLVTTGPDQIREIEAVDEPLGAMKIRLRDGTALTGTFADETLTLELTPGPQLRIHVSHIQSIAVPEGYAAAGKEPDGDGEPDEEDKADAPELSTIEAVEERMAQLRAEINAEQERLKELSAAAANDESLVGTLKAGTKRMGALRAEMEELQNRLAQMRKEEAQRRAEEAARAARENAVREAVPAPVPGPPGRGR